MASWDSHSWGHGSESTLVHHLAIVCLYIQSSKTNHLIITPQRFRGVLRAQESPPPHKENRTNEICQRCRCDKGVDSANALYQAALLSRQTPQTQGSHSRNVSSLSLEAGSLKSRLAPAKAVRGSLPQACPLAPGGSVAPWPGDSALFLLSPRCHPSMSAAVPKLPFSSKT